MLKRLRLKITQQSLHIRQNETKGELCADTWNFIIQ